VAGRASGLVWGAGMVICLERCADLHMALLMPLPLTVSCFSEIQIGYTFLISAHLGSLGKVPLNGCVCVFITDHFSKKLVVSGCPFIFFHSSF